MFFLSYYRSNISIQIQKSPNPGLAYSYRQMMMIYFQITVSTMHLINPVKHINRYILL